ncbi:serine palmitoyltransferase 1-like [Rhopilema esculentum]
MDEAASESFASNEAKYILSFTLYLSRFVGFVENTLKVPFYHVLLETILILWIIRLLATKSYTPREQRLKLSKEEEEALIQEWEPEPLVPKTGIDDYIVKPKIVNG